MFSKKDDFTDIIQFKIGNRIDELSSNDYNCINDLALIFQNKNDKSQWKPLYFLNTYFFIKKNIEKLTSKTTNSNSDINKILSKRQRIKLEIILKRRGIEPIERTHINIISNLIIIFPAITILGSMIFSTYLITAKDYTGWVYLSGLIGVILSVILLKLTRKLKTQFNPKSILEYSKSTYVIRHKLLKKTSNTNEQLLIFILDEYKLLYKKDISVTEVIPLN